MGHLSLALALARSACVTACSVPGMAASNMARLPWQVARLLWKVAGQPVTHVPKAPCETCAAGALHQLCTLRGIIATGLQAVAALGSKAPVWWAGVVPQLYKYSRRPYKGRGLQFKAAADCDERRLELVIPLLLRHASPREHRGCTAVIIICLVCASAHL